MWNESVIRTVVPNPVCTVLSLGGLTKDRFLSPTPRESNYIGLGLSLDRKIFLNCLCTIKVVVLFITKSCLTATPWTAAHQASPSFAVSQSLLKLMSIELLMPFNHLILCRPLLLLRDSIAYLCQRNAAHLCTYQPWTEVTYTCWDMIQVGKGRCWVFPDKPPRGFLEGDKLAAS